MGDIIITPTPYSKGLLETYKLNKPIYAISNGINLDIFKKNEDLAKKFRKYFNFKKEDKIIISCGIYIERKGIVDFVELARRLPEYKFVWFGSSSLNLSTKVIKKAINTKLDNLYFPGYVDLDILKGGYSSADIFAFLTYEENEGLPVMEVAASNINLLVRDIPVFEDWLIDNKNVYKGKDINDFEDKIKKIINKELPNLSKETIKIAEDREITKVGKQLVELYKELNKK